LHYSCVLRYAFLMSSPVQSVPAVSRLPASLPGLKVHVPELDGVRGMAVLLVVLYHLQLFARVGDQGTLYGWVASIGWSGVDLFFVLSGFLITGILLDSRYKEKYFQNFYARRVLRIFPLYYVVVGAVFVGGPALLWHFSHDNALIARSVKPGSQVFAWTYTFNLPFAFDPNRVSKLIAPLWSLSVEEQFYLVWPLAVYLLRPQALRSVCLALIGGALMVRVAFAVAGNTNAAYALTPCRSDALALGALLALTVRAPGGIEKIRRWGWKICLVALVGVTAATLIRGTDFKDSIIVTAGISLVGLLYAAALGTVVSAPEGSRVRSGLRLCPLRFLGKYSYAIYMFHQAIITVLLKRTSPASLATQLHSILAGDVAFCLIVGTASVVAAMASWWLLEKRFLALKRAFSY
jgi:peptidoglycan/LPS O-acetylase OafA/YrhL